MPRSASAPLIVAAARSIASDRIESCWRSPGWRASRWAPDGCARGGPQGRHHPHPDRLKTVEQRFPEGSGDAEEMGEKLGVEVEPVVDLEAGDHQGVAGPEWTVGEEGHRTVVLPDEARGQFAIDDPGEDAGHGLDCDRRAAASVPGWCPAEGLRLGRLLPGLLGLGLPLSLAGRRRPGLFGLLLGRAAGLLACHGESLTEPESRRPGEGDGYARARATPMELSRQTYTGEVLDPLQGFAPARTSVEVRWDPLLGHPARLVRSRTPLLPRSNVDLEALAASGREGCPFCPERVLEVTPRLRPEIHQGRISRGEALLFPNLLAYWQHGSVSVYSPQLHFLPLGPHDRGADDRQPRHPGGVRESGAGF